MIMPISPDPRNAVTKNIGVTYDKYKENKKLWVPLVKIGEMRITLPVRRMKLLAESDYTIISAMIANEVYKSIHGHDRYIIELSEKGVNIAPNPEAVEPPMMGEII